MILLSVSTPSVGVKRTEANLPSSITQTVYTPTVKGTIKRSTHTVPTGCSVNTHSTSADVKNVGRTVFPSKTQGVSTSGETSKTRIPFCGDHTRITTTPISKENLRTNKINVYSSNSAQLRNNVSSSRDNIKYPPFSVTDRTANIPCTKTTAPCTETTNLPSSKAEDFRTLSDSNMASESDMAAVETLLSLSEAISKGEMKSQIRRKFTVNQQPFSPPRHTAVDTISSQPVSTATVYSQANLDSNVVPNQRFQSTSVAAPKYFSSSGLPTCSFISGISSSTNSKIKTSTSNTPTCSNVNVLKSPVRTAGQVFLPTPNSPSHVIAPPQGITQVPEHQNVQLIWTTRDDNAVTVEYNGKTFRVPVTSVPESLSRNLRVGSQQAYVTETGEANALPSGRVISIQAPLITPPNLAVQTMSVQNPIVASPNRNAQVVSVQTPMVVSPNRNSQVVTVQTPMVASPNHNSQVVNVQTPVVVSPNRNSQVLTVQTPMVSTPHRRTIQLIPNIQNPHVIAAPVQTTSVLSTNTISTTHPSQVLSIPNSPQGNANSQSVSISTQNVTNSLNLVTKTPCTRVGYLQGVQSKFNYGGPTIPTASTAGSPQRATQHIRIVYSPHRPMTRSQVQPTRPVTRAYARDSPRFAPWNSNQPRVKTSQQTKKSNVKSVSGHVLTKPYRTQVPNANGRQTKQVYFLGFL